MDTIYEKVKANSKFFKMLEDYNVTGQPTVPGASPGTLPVEPQIGAATGNMDPKVIAAQRAAQQKTQKAQVDAAKAELANLQNTAKNLPAQQKAVADRIKALQQTIKNAGKLSAATPL